MSVLDRIGGETFSCEFIVERNLKEIAGFEVDGRPGNAGLATLLQAIGPRPDPGNRPLLAGNIERRRKIPLPKLDVEVHNRFIVFYYDILGADRFIRILPKGVEPD